MDLIILGVFDNSEKNNLDKLVSTLGGLEIIWNFKKYDIESSVGISLMKEAYSILSVGILVEKKRNEIITSYPLIYEISETFMGKDKTPKLFNFLDKLESLSLKKLIIAFADEWNENSLVKVEKSYFNTLKQRLNSHYVWCDSYLNLVSNTEVRGDEHPLILEVEQGVVL